MREMGMMGRRLDDAEDHGEEDVQGQERDEPGNAQHGHQQQHGHSHGRSGMGMGMMGRKVKDGVRGMMGRKVKDKVEEGHHMHEKVEEGHHHHEHEKVEGHMHEKARAGMKKKKGKGKKKKHHHEKGKDKSKNPVKYIRSIGHNIVTSLTDQTTTSLTVTTSPHNEQEDYLVLVAFLAYKSANSGTTSCADSLGNTYTKLSEVSFNSGYVLSLFAASGVASLAKNAIVTVTHPGSQRRIVMGDEFKNAEGSSPADKTAAAYNSVAATFATSGMTAETTQDRELLYGLIGVNGPSTDGFKRPGNWTILHDRGTNAGDSNDIRLLSLFRLTNETGTYEVSGTLDTARLWASITQTFKAEGGSSDVSKD